MTDKDETLAALRLNDAGGVAQHEAVVVLGSGWAPAADQLGTAHAETAVADLPGFAAPRVAGHGGTVRSVRIGSQNVLVFVGRTHLYEGRGPGPVVHPLRVAATAGCRIAILTNAAGGLRPGMQIGQPVLISDHINMTGVSPLVGPEFVDMTEAYSPRLRALATELQPELTFGVYAAMPGPQYETPAEIRALRTLGADLVGMSTVVETIAARQRGLEVLGISLVTNLAAGLSPAPLAHEEVIAAGKSAAATMGTLIKRVIEHV